MKYTRTTTKNRIPNFLKYALDIFIEIDMNHKIRQNLDEVVLYKDEMWNYILKCLIPYLNWFYRFEEVVNCFKTFKGDTTIKLNR